jgi:hypothetical protein
MFFSKLPNLEYTPKRVKYKFTNQDFVLAKNIFKTIIIDNSLYATDLFTEVQLNEGVRPDQVAEGVYGDPNYDWVVLLTNKIKDTKNDWPLSSAEFEKLVAKKYPNAFDIRHWETIEVKNDIGEVVQPGRMIVNYNPSDPDSYKLRYIKSYNPFVEEIENGLTLLRSVSHYEYEQELNEKRRFLQILKPAYLQSFVSIFKLSVDYQKNEYLGQSANVRKTLNKTSIFNNVSLSSF